MQDLEVENDLVRFVADDADPGVLRPGVDLDPVAADAGKVPYVRLRQDRHTGKLPVDDRPVLFRQPAEMRFRREARRLFVFVEQDNQSFPP